MSQEYGSRLCPVEKTAWRLCFCGRPVDQMTHQTIPFQNYRASVNFPTSFISSKEDAYFTVAHVLPTDARFEHSLESIAGQPTLSEMARLVV